MRPVFCGLLLLLANLATFAEPPAPVKALAKMPVKEVTVFKDGYAFVLHQGVMPTDAGGNVVMDYLPAPVLGTFWPFAGREAPRLQSVRAGQRKVLVERTALNLRELIEANVGAAVIVTEVGGAKYSATIADVPARSGDELEATGVPNGGPKLSQKGAVVLLRTEDGIKVMPFERVQDMVFKNGPNGLAAGEEFRNLLTLQLDWGERKPEKTAEVGMVYLQRGLRWIPGYQLDIDGKGTAKIRLQATLLNEMTDLQDVTANLVIGVPTFNFKDTVDPVALQQAAAELSPYFRQDSQTAYAFSNSIMAQSARMGETREPAPPAGNLGPEIGEGAKTEDLFVFTVNHLTLGKGERIVVPVAEYTVPYRDIYTLELPYAPPPELARSRNLNSAQEAELARLYYAPKVMHAVRLTNKGALPFTTAPALILRAGRVLGQGMMTYTSPGAETDLPITTAVDIQVAKKETETKRTPNAMTFNNDAFLRIDLTGSVSLTNRLAQPVELEITRYVLGNVDAADHDGKVAMANVFEDTQYRPVGAYPGWWGWYDWPYWWSRVNGLGAITWKTTLGAGKSIDLGYSWHYFWR